MGIYLFFAIVTTIDLLNGGNIIFVVPQAAFAGCYSGENRLQRNFTHTAGKLITAASVLCYESIHSTMINPVEIGVEGPMPRSVKPMLCTLLKQPFTDTNYVFEVKWDGYRIIAYKSDTIKLESRSGHDYTRRYPPVQAGLSAIAHEMVLDGEIIAVNSEGKPDFDALQKFNGQKSGVLYYVFDLLWLNGKNLMKRPLLERKHLLREVIADHATIRYSDHFEDGMVLFKHIEALNLEGIVAKRKDSQYIPGKRGRDWYKTPAVQESDFIIGGYVESERRLFRTLLFGRYEEGQLKWLGHAGGGYKDYEMPLILQRLQDLEIPDSPFVNEVDYRGVVHWVKPELVAGIRYATFTKGGRIRKPAIFLGFRKANNISRVASATAKGPESLQQNTPAQKKKTESMLPAAERSNWPEVESEIIKNEQEISVDGCKIRLYNVERELWKGITKADLLQYYHSIAVYILPHLQHRPLSLHLKLKGPYASGIYIKDMEGREPACGEVFTTGRRHKKAGKRDMIDYLICNNAATLLYVVNLGCIDFNPWTSRSETSTRPDYIIIDLDPSDGDFQKAVETAQVAKEFFDRHKLTALVKTSGKSGIHLYLPCRAFSFPQARKIAENICKELHSLLPAITTTAVMIADRGDKLYLDPNQNDYADTVAAPYAVRPFKIPAVSTPLEWKEVNSKLDPASFTMHNMLVRLTKKGDLFMKVLDKGIAERNDTALMRFL